MRDNQASYGIPPYEPERDDELAQEALEDDHLQTTDEPILQTEISVDAEDWEEIDSWAETTEELH